MSHQPNRLDHNFLFDGAREELGLVPVSISLTIEATGGAAIGGDSIILQLSTETSQGGAETTNISQLHYQYPKPLIPHIPGQIDIKGASTCYVGYLNHICKNNEGFTCLTNRPNLHRHCYNKAFFNPRPNKLHQSYGKGAYVPAVTVCIQGPFLPETKTDKVDKQAPRFNKDHNHPQTVNYSSYQIELNALSIGIQTSIEARITPTLQSLSEPIQKTQLSKPILKEVVIEPKIVKDNTYFNVSPNKLHQSNGKGAYVPALTVNNQGPFLPGTQINKIDKQAPIFNKDNGHLQSIQSSDRIALNALSIGTGTPTSIEARNSTPKVSEPRVKPKPTKPLVKKTIEPKTVRNQAYYKPMQNKFRQSNGKSAYVPAVTVNKQGPFLPD